MTDLQTQYFLSRFRQAIDYWGLESFVGAHIEQAEKRTRDLSDQEMKQLCELLIDNCERAPSIVKIAGFASMIRAKRQKAVQSAGVIGCKSCDGDGYRSEVREIGGYFYSYAIPCIRHIDETENNGGAACP